MFKFTHCLVNYGVVLPLCVASLMAGSTIGVPMSPGYGEFQTATPPPYYTSTTYALTGYYTTKVPDYYTTTFDAPSCITKVS
jgi:hypothetical protein